MIRLLLANADRFVEVSASARVAAGSYSVVLLVNFFPLVVVAGLVGVLTVVLLALLHLEVSNVSTKKLPDFSQVPVRDARNFLELRGWPLDVTVLAERPVYAEPIKVVVALAGTSLIFEVGRDLHAGLDSHPAALPVGRFHVVVGLVVVSLAVVLFHRSQVQKSSKAILTRQLSSERLLFGNHGRQGGRRVLGNHRECVYIFRRHFHVVVRSHLFLRRLDREGWFYRRERSQENRLLLAIS